MELYRQSRQAVDPETNRSNGHCTGHVYGHVTNQEVANTSKYWCCGQKGNLMFLSFNHRAHTFFGSSDKVMVMTSQILGHSFSWIPFHLYFCWPILPLFFLFSFHLKSKNCWTGRRKKRKKIASKHKKCRRGGGMKQVLESSFILSTFFCLSYQLFLLFIPSFHVQCIHSHVHVSFSVSFTSVSLTCLPVFVHFLYSSLLHSRLPLSMSLLTIQRRTHTKRGGNNWQLLSPFHSPFFIVILSPPSFFILLLLFIISLLSFFIPFLFRLSFFWTDKNVKLSLSLHSFYFSSLDLKQRERESLCPLTWNVNNVIQHTAHTHKTNIHNNK